MLPPAFDLTAARRPQPGSARPLRWRTVSPRGTNVGWGAVILAGRRLYTSSAAAGMHGGERTSTRGDPLATAEKELEALLGDAAELRAQVQRRIVGQERVLEEVIIALLAGGHVLLVGVPGLAKTLLVRTLAQALELEFKRVQFTPDLMPGDITGTEVIEEDRTTGRRAARLSIISPSDRPPFVPAREPSVARVPTFRGTPAS